MMSTTREKAAERLAALDAELDGDPVTEQTATPVAPAAQYITLDEAKGMAAEAAQAAARIAVESMTARAAVDDTAAPGSISAELKGLLDGLAMSLASVGNQGTGKVIVDPGVMAARARAHDLMLERMVRARQDGIRPKYELTGKVVLGNQLIEPVWTDDFRRERPQVVFWDGTPNQKMQPAKPDNAGEVPACEAAHDIFVLFCESIGVSPQASMRIMAINNHGNMVSPRGNVFEQPPIPPPINKESVLYGGNLSVTTPSWPQAEAPVTGVNVRAASGHELKTQTINVLGSIAKPAVQQVA